MPNVIDAKGKVLRRRRGPGSIRRRRLRQDATRSSARSSAKWPARAPARTRRSSATKCAAADASRGSKRAPAARVKVRSVRPSGVTAAWSSGRSRAATSARSTRKSAKPRSLAALADKFQNGAVTLLATDGLALTKTKEFATLIFGSPKAAKTGVRTLVVFAESELATVGESLARTGNNLVNIAVTHTGALDIKDIVGYPRLVLTTAANDALIARFATEKKSA